LFVPWEGQVVTIDSIGPSSAYEFLNGCRLKAVLSKYPNSTNCRNGIPIHPNSSIGTIFHRLLEGARRNQPPNGSDSWTVEFANSVLEDLTNEENQRLEANNLNAHLIPLQTKPVYFSRSMNGIFAAVRINSETTVGFSQSALGTNGAHTLFGAEINVWDLEETWPKNLGKSGAQNFSIYGQIDRVTQNGNRIVIEDLKTGNIFDENNELKGSYITQLRLYAELWIMTARFRHGMDDVSMLDIDLFVVDDSGARHPVSNQYEERITDQIRSLLLDTNQVISKTSINKYLADLIATPNPSSCRFCRHRTGCKAYLDQLLSNSGCFEDRFDLIGVIASLPIPNGVGSLDFQFKLQTESDLWLVDRVNQRWIDSANLQIGETIGVFGGSEIECEARLNFDRFFKCSPNQQALYQFQETQQSE